MKRRRPGPLVGFYTLIFSHVIVSFFLYFFVFWYSLFFLFLFLISFFSFSCLSFSFLIAFLFCLFWLLPPMKIMDFAKKISFILLKIFFYWSYHKNSNFKLHLKLPSKRESVYSENERSHPTSVILKIVWQHPNLFKISNTQEICSVQYIYIYMYIYTPMSRVYTTLFIRKLKTKKVGHHPPSTIQIKKMSSGLKVRS